MNKELFIQIGERLRSERKKQGLTQARAAELLGISLNYYGQVERGNKKLSVEMILKIYEKMGIEPTYLLTGETLSNKELARLFEDCPKDKRAVVEQLLRCLPMLYS